MSAPDALRLPPPPTAVASGRRVGPVPAAVWALVALQLALGIAWAVVVPSLRGADEPQHVDLALSIARGRAYPLAFDGRMNAQLEAVARLGNLSSDDVGAPDRTVRFTAGEAPDRRARPSFSGAAPDAPTATVNQMPQHPPLAYLADAAVLRALPDATSWDVQVLALRVLGAVWTAPLPLLCWRTAAALTGDRGSALTAAVFPVAIPQLAHVAGSVTNDSLLILATGVVGAGLGAVLGGDLRARTGAVVGLAAGVATLTKGLGLMVVAWIALAYAVALWRTGSRWWTGGVRDRVRPLAGAGLALGATAFFGAWWWVRNLVLYGTVQPDAQVRALPPEGFAPDALSWAQLAATRFVLRFWGQFGWLEAALPWALVWLLALALTAAVVVTLVGRRWPARHRRWELCVLLAPIPLLLAIVLPGAWTVYSTSGGPGGLQGRYLYGGVTGLAAVVAVGAVAGLPRTWSRWVAPALLSLAGALQVTGAFVALRHWYGPADGTLSEAWRGLMAWSPLPPRGVLGVLGLAVAAGAVALAALVLDQRRGVGRRP